MASIGVVVVVLTYFLKKKQPKDFDTDEEGLSDEFGQSDEESDKDVDDDEVNIFLCCCLQSKVLPPLPKKKKARS